MPKYQIHAKNKNCSSPRHPVSWRWLETREARLESISWWAKGLVFENCNCQLVCPGHIHFDQVCTHERCKGYWAIVFEDGETIREQWDGQEAWTKLTFVRATKLTSATVDPDRNVPLDINYTNNSRTLEPQKLGITKVAARWMFWWQFILDLVSL